VLSVRASILEVMLSRRSIPLVLSLVFLFTMIGVALADAPAAYFPHVYAYYPRGGGGYDYRQPSLDHFCIDHGYSYAVNVDYANICGWWVNVWYDAYYGCEWVSDGKNSYQNCYDHPAGWGSYYGGSCPDNEYPGPMADDIWCR
jgi:hypothetical protein